VTWLKQQGAWETVGGTYGAPDTVEMWLALETAIVSQANDMWIAGVPCRRRLVREALTRQVWDDSGDDAAVWGGSPQAASGPSRLKEIEIEAARYDYEIPRVFQWLFPELARRAYLAFRATELDAEYRLLGEDSGGWAAHVRDMLLGVERAQSTR
jgi:hypothetical protein